MKTKIEELIEAIDEGDTNRQLELIKEIGNDLTITGLKLLQEEIEDNYSTSYEPYFEVAFYFKDTSLGRDWSEIDLLLDKVKEHILTKRQKANEKYEKLLGIPAYTTENTRIYVYVTTSYPDLVEEHIKEKLHGIGKIYMEVI